MQMPSFGHHLSVVPPSATTTQFVRTTSSPSEQQMWIYSLGVTLQKTISSFSVNYHQHQQKQHQQQQQLRNDADGRRSAAGTVTPTDEDGLTALDHVILAMCEANLYKRASLMFLLDVSRRVAGYFVSWYKGKLVMGLFFLCGRNLSSPIWKMCQDWITSVECCVEI